MARAFKELKCLMLREDVTQDDIKDIVGKSRSYVTSRMCGQAPWNMDEVYAICEALNINLAEIPKYFPPNRKAPSRKLVIGA